MAPGDTGDRFSGVKCVLRPFREQDFVLPGAPFLMMIRESEFKFTFIFLSFFPAPVWFIQPMQLGFFRRSPLFHSVVELQGFQAF